MRSPINLGGHITHSNDVGLSKWAVWHIPTVLLAVCIIASSGCSFTTVRTLVLKDGYPAKDSSAVSGPAVTVFPVGESFPKSGSYSSFRSDPTFLGNNLDWFFLDVLIPAGLDFNEFHTDLPRSEIISNAIKAQLEEQGIPPVLSKDDVERFPKLPEDHLGIAIDIREFDAHPSGRLLPLLIIWVYRPYHVVAHIVLNCKVLEPGQDKPLWEGQGEATNQEPQNFRQGDAFGFGGAEAAVLKAASAAVSDCVSKSGLFRIRESLASKRYAELMANARAQETSGDSLKAFVLFGQAYDVAVLPAETAAADKEVSRILASVPAGAARESYVHAVSVFSADSKFGAEIINSMNNLDATEKAANLSAILRRGDKALTAGDAAGARTAYLLALKSLPSDSESEADDIRRKLLAATLLQGDNDLKSGDAAGALTTYKRALGFVTAGTDREGEIQEKVIDAASSINPRPLVPEDARDLMAEGKAYVAEARGAQDYVKGAASMKKALAIAPWWAAGYFNTALAEEGAGEWAEAQQHLKIYLKLNPDAEDKEKVREKIAVLKIHVERGDSAPGRN